MNRSQFWAIACDLKEHPENLPKYREIYRNVYPFSDGIFTETSSARQCHDVQVTKAQFSLSRKEK